MFIGCADFLSPIPTTSLRQKTMRSKDQFLLTIWLNLFIKFPKKSYINFGREDKIMSIKTPFGY